MGKRAKSPVVRYGYGGGVIGRDGYDGDGW
jgi:hypothetical protein